MEEGLKEFKLAAGGVDDGRGMIVRVRQMGYPLQATMAIPSQIAISTVLYLIIGVVLLGLVFAS